MQVIKNILTTLGVIFSIPMMILIVFIMTLLPLLLWIAAILVTTWLMTLIGIPTNIGLWISGLTLLAIEIIHLLNRE